MKKSLSMNEADTLKWLLTNINTKPVKSMLASMQASTIALNSNNRGKQTYIRSYIACTASNAETCM